MLHYQQNNKSIVSFRAGAGIVADSDPEFELTESRHKAKGLIKAFSEVNS
jgi:anthranilate synthase component 1